MHPSHEELRLFIEKKTEDISREKEITEHIDQCEFCRDYCREYELLKQADAKVKITEISGEAAQLVDRVYLDALRSKVIELRPLRRQTATSTVLAADGEETARPDVENIATLYSESPEVVLRLMRDNSKGQDYIQLIGDSESLQSHVIVQIPEINREFLTDINGRVVLEESLSEDILQMKWQIKLPDVNFSLSPLKYDPEAVQYKKEMILETEKKDRIKVTFLGKTESKQISVAILELGGNSDFGTVRVTVSQAGLSQIKELAPSKVAIFEISGPEEEIKIGLFQ